LEISDESEVFQNQKSSSLKGSTKKAKKVSKGRRKKRKNVNINRNLYRKRKDVILKSILRRCRKYFLDSYTNFTRAQFLQRPKMEGLDNPDIFSANLGQNTMQPLTKDMLISFTEDLFGGSIEHEDLYMYIGALISPQDFKAKLTETESDSELIEVCELVYEVLYKFSYQKLGRFCKIPQLIFLYSHFYENCELSEVDLQVGKTIQASETTNN
jgi:hypothetical protein